MIIYNVTVNIDENVHDEWLVWMKETHIPEVMKSGKMLSSKMSKILAYEQGGLSYSIQYEMENMETYKSYEKDHAPQLKKDHEDKYAGKFVAFRTLLEVIDQQ